MDLKPGTEFSGVESPLVIKQGWVKMRSKKMGFSMIWKKRWIALFRPSSGGPTRLVKYADDKAASEEEQLSETKLQEVVSVVRLATEDRPGITLQMIDHTTKQFYCFSDDDANDWLQKLQNEAKKTDHLPPGMFYVFLIPTSTLDFFGECVIEVDSANASLYDNKNRENQIAQWPITSIRRYGNDVKKKRILIEVGRLCPTGEGVYLMKSVYHNEIQKLLDKQAKKIRQGSLRTDTDEHTYVNGPPK